MDATPSFGVTKIPEVSFNPQLTLGGISFTLHQINLVFPVPCDAPSIKKRLVCSSFEGSSSWMPIIKT